jgi:hypothetical protein
MKIIYMSATIDWMISNDLDVQSLIKSGTVKKIEDTNYLVTENYEQD